MGQKKLNLLVRRDLSQKSYRMAMAVHAGVVWAFHHGDDAAFDWKVFPDCGPIVVIYGADDEAALEDWEKILTNTRQRFAAYREPDHNDELMSLAFYGFMPDEHGLRLL